MERGVLPEPLDMVADARDDSSGVDAGDSPFSALSATYRKLTWGGKEEMEGEEGDGGGRRKPYSRGGSDAQIYRGPRRPCHGTVSSSLSLTR